MAKDDSDGVASYQGYEYQILATVWLILQFLIGRKDCEFVTVEPASGEDVAAELAVPPETAVANVTLDLTPQSLEVQVKLRQTDQWTPATFQTVVRGGVTSGKGGRAIARRRPIKLLLSQANSRFVLLTNAQVNRKLQPFLIERLGDDSAGTKIPGAAAAGETPQTAKRVGILQQLHPDVLQVRIDALLQQAGIPQANRQACAGKLQEEVRSRLLRRTNPKFTRDELVALLRAFDGLPPENPGEFFVAPTSFGAMAQKLETEHRLTIVGPPGTGKTLSAEELVRQHRVAEDAFKIIFAATPADIAGHLELPGRYLFFVEDPWGQFKLSEDADYWVTALPKLLPRANSDKRFLITTRTAIQNTAFASRVPQELVASQYLLNESQYTVEQRWEILERTIADAVPWQRDFVQQHREQILRSLTAPYSLTTFATQLKRAASAQEVQVDQLIRDSNVEVIGATVANELRALGRETIAGTIALWVWTMARYTITLKAADRLRHRMRDGGFAGDLDVRKLLTHLVAAQWFREQEGVFSAHPTVLQGLELVVSSEPALTDDMLIALLEGLAKENHGEQAHRIRKNLAGRQLPLPLRVQQIIDSYLLSRLKDASGYDFTEAYKEAAGECRSSDPVALLARALRAKPNPHGGFWDYEPWQPPVLDASAIQQIQQSTEAREFAGKFVRTMLSSDAAEPYNASQLQAFFAQFGWSLTEDFVLAVEAGLEQDNFRCEVAVEGALAGNDPPFDRVLEAALRHYDATCSWWEAEQETYRQARQGEMDAAYASHIEEQPQERFGPSSAVLKTAVAVRNQREGHGWLVKHPRKHDLLEAWAETVTKSTTVSELQDLAAACPPNRLRDFFQAVGKSENKQFAPTLLAATLTASASGTAGWRALMTLLTSAELVQFTRETASSLTLVQRLEVAEAVNTTRGYEIDEGDAKAEGVLNVLLNAQDRRLWELTQSDQIGEAQPPTENTQYFLDSLQTIAATSTAEELAIRAAFQLAAWKQDIGDHLPKFLASEAFEIRVNAIRLLALRNDAASRAHLCAALGDPDYHCRREAMTLLAKCATESDKQAILALARDPSAPVRQVCAEIIGELSWDDAQPVLCELLRDRRSNQHGVGLVRGQFPSFHVAQAAAQALTTFTDRVLISTVHSVKSFLDERQPDRDDARVHCYALEFLGGVQSPEVIKLLVQYLNDDWHLDGIKHAGFPLRYSAAWSLLTQLLNDDSVADVISLDALYQAARHDDSRLAGPSLVCLGLCGPRATGQIVQLCRQTELTANRAALLRVALALCGTNPPPELAQMLADHPVEAIIRAAQSDTPWDEVTWKQFCEANPAVHTWLNTIQSGDDIQPVLRLSFYELFDHELEVSFPRRDLRQHEFPQTFPVMNLRTMTGGE